ncbi:MAG: desulfoferrodoxin [Clostridia bacterium]|nr:desulfoferrodoxin [Clostridia bacterium]
MNFYICNHCKQIATKLTDKNIPIMCCGQAMQELPAGTTEASLEKHIPVFTVENNTVFVTVGEILHPMTPEHYIEWICLETNLGTQLKHLEPNASPKATFALNNEEQVVAVYAYCNLHSLWKA